MSYSIYLLCLGFFNLSLSLWDWSLMFMWSDRSFSLSKCLPDKDLQEHISSWVELGLLICYRKRKCTPREVVEFLNKVLERTYRNWVFAQVIWIGESIQRHETLLWIRYCQEAGVILWVFFLIYLFVWLCLGLSCIGEGNGSPLQCSCLENPRDGGAWWAAVYGVTQSRTWLKRLSSSSSR